MFKCTAQGGGFARDFYNGNHITGDLCLIFFCAKTNWKSDGIKYLHLVSGLLDCGSDLGALG